ncbi:MAG: FAD-binding protein, partial [Elusimicrobia bacterium]|nr:FAD-binding protein [Elusimicrobiota bacterium]
GAVAGRFGAGVEKRMALPLQYSDSELGLLRAIKEASDPADLCNPEKILPVSTARSHKKGQQALPRPVLDLVSELQCRVQNSTASFICGSGSRLHGRQAGEKLSTLGLDAVLETDLDGGYITVGAGMKLSALAEEFSRLGLKAPFHSRKGTLGGLLATGQWLPPEGLLVSLSVALADGSTAQFGALSLEPGSGSGAGRLFLGSWGSYGVLLSATFALYCPVASPAREQEKPEFRAPSSGPELKFKKVFDPLGLLNPGLSQEGA